MDTRLILHGGKEVEWVLNQLWVHFRLFLMSFEYTYIPQKLRIQQPKRWIVHCSNKHLKTARTNIINGSSVPWILNILVALINQSQKCHYRKNSLLLYFFFPPYLFQRQCSTGSFETTKIPLQVHLGLLHWERNNHKVSFAHLLFALVAMVCRW